MRANSLFLPLSYLLVFGLIPFQALAGIEGTVHDLSAAPNGQGACTFCHTGHGAATGTVLWNIKSSNTVYNIYQSTSLEAQVGQPTGSSKLCLSCHDGTVASIELLNGTTTSITYLSPDKTKLGSDLSDDHPISFIYSSAISAKDPQIRPPEFLPEQVQLDRSFELQCTTCHDPHDNSFGSFLVMPNDQSALCITCHNLNGWDNSVHKTSTVAVINANDTYLRDSKYVTMNENGCNSCHRPHSAGGRQRLLHFPQSEDNCLSCHNGSVAQTNLLADLNKLSGHDVRRFDGLHTVNETPGAFSRHVECVDCHNPHAVWNNNVDAPLAAGALQNVSGVTLAGGTTNSVSNEYELCFKCHADNPDRIDSTITRQITQTNTRLEFSSSNPSFHPVLAPGVNQDVPSLEPGLNVTNQIYCTSCHNSDASSSVKGPHGSQYAPLLAYNYQTADQTEESFFAYELCYQCHRRNSILADKSFPHSEHLEEKVPCSACHDPHGINSTQGSVSQNSHLINFDISIVAPDRKTGRLEFEDLGNFQGRCFLSCHGKNHSPKSYPHGMGM